MSADALPKHCPTCTCPTGAEVGTYCDSEAHHGEETFGCLEWKGHAPPHRGQLVPPACPACHGLDRHVTGCARIGTDAEDASLLEVRWLDDQPGVTLVPLGD